MIRLKVILALLIACCLVGLIRAQAQVEMSEPAPTPSTVTQTAPPLTDRQALETFITDIVQEQLESQHIPGATVAIVKDGQIHFAKGYGYADVEAKRPVDPAQTIFRVGSVAKLFVGTAVMQLVEQGKLELDADVNGYLSAFQIPATYPEPITLWHLLTHTAGFEERLIGDAADQPEAGPAPLAQALQGLMPARVRPPGRVASYSNWGVSLAGHIVAQVSGLSFAEYVERHIFTPLQMTHSTYLEPLPPALADDMAIGYHYQDGVFEAQDFEIIAEHGPAGALSSTAIDMAHFMSAHLQAGRFGAARILSEDTMTLMHRRQFGNHPGQPGMAMSFGVAHVDGRHLLQHNGATFVFHANLALLPRAGVGLFIAFNGPGSADEEILSAFLDRYFPRTERPEVTPPKDFAERSAKYVGSYRSNRLAFVGLEKVLRFIELTVHDTGRNTLFLGDLLSDLNNPEHGIELVEIEPNLFYNADKKVLIAFSEDAMGEIDHLHVGGAMPSFHRIAWYETIHVLGAVMALSFIIFFLAGLAAVQALRRRRRQALAEPAAVRTGRGLMLGLCAINAVFAAGFTTLVLTHADPFRYPPGTMAMLALPVASVGLTGATALFVLIAWLKGYGSAWSRVRDTGLVLASAVFLGVLNLWNIIGWQL